MEKRLYIGDFVGVGVGGTVVKGTIKYFYGNYVYIVSEIGKHHKFKKDKLVLLRTNSVA